MGYTFSRIKYGRKVLFESKNMRLTTIISHVNINEWNHLVTSNSYNVIETSNFTHSKVQNVSSFNKLFALQKIIDTESIFVINIWRAYQKHLSEEIYSHQNSAEIIYHTCDNNGIILVNT